MKVQAAAFMKRYSEMIASLVATPQSESGYRRTEPIQTWIQQLLPAAVISMAFLHNCFTSWRKWGSIIVDGGREMEVARRMAEGEVLYVDLRNQYGPLAPHVNAFLFRLFGVHIDVLIAAGLISALLSTIALYLLARMFLGRPAATIVVVAEIYLFFFAHLTLNPSFNFVLPYSYAATYGMLAATTSLLLLVWHTHTSRMWMLSLSAAFLALTALSKFEVLVPASGAHMAWLLGTAATGGLTLRLLGPYIAAATAVVTAYGWLALRVGRALWVENIGALFNRDYAVYARMTMGFDHIADSLREVGLSLILIVFFLGIGIVATLAASQPGAAWRRTILAVGAFVISFVGYTLLPPSLSLRIMPIVAITAFAIAVTRYWRYPVCRTDILPDIILWVFVLGCLSRIPLRSGPEHYGFFLMPVPFLALGVFLFRYVPDMLHARSWTKAPFQSASAGMIVGITLAVFLVSRNLYALHQTPLDTQRGRLILMSDGLEPALVRFLSTFPPTTRVVVVPQGAGLTFFSGLKGNDAIFAYLPMEMIGEYADDALVNRWQNYPPDLIVLLRQDLSGLGFRGFGIDYGIHSSSWIFSNYIPLTDPNWPAVVLARRPHGAP